LKAPLRDLVFKKREKKIKNEERCTPTLREFAGGGFPTQVPGIPCWESDGVATSEVDADFAAEMAPVPVHPPAPHQALVAELGG
jgi:hypothetical protein